MKTLKINGIGLYEDGEFPREVDGQLTHLYKKWCAMLVRVAYDSKRKPHYAGVTICEEFTRFQSFAKWASQQRGHDDPSWELDKDMIEPGNRVYAPDKCTFVPAEINILLTNSKRSRGQFPIGVTAERNGRYRAACWIDGKRVRLFGFTTPECAFAVYKVIKELNVKRVAEKYRGEVDGRVYQRLMNFTVNITD